MAHGFQAARRGEEFVLSGSFDEAADFSFLAGEAAPLMRLNLAGIQTINSLGLRRLIAFSKGLGARAVEFTECPPVFVEAVNISPLAVGGPAYIKRIKSVLIPYHCSADHEQMHVVPVEIVRQDEDFLLPEKTCKTCAQPMTPDLESDTDEFFFFLTVQSG